MTTFIEKYDFENLKNDGETIIIQELERQLANYEQVTCLCNECVLDMAAVALNSLKPLYRVSLLGSLYTASAMDQDAYAANVKNVVAGAIEKVQQNPSHDLTANAGTESAD